MNRTIPQAALALVADEAVASQKTHAKLDSLLTQAGCPNEPFEGGMQAKALFRLRLVSTDAGFDPLAVLGKVIEESMDAPLDEDDWRFKELTTFRRKMTAALASSQLQYRYGGQIVGTLALPTKTLETFMKERNVEGINAEFDRASQKADSEPREAVSAAANILESLCKHYIEEEGLTLPDKQVLGDLWQVVRKHLGFDPAKVADTDLRGVLSGLIGVVQGLAAFRTHASSAHGEGPKSYRLEPRHSRLAVYAAHTVALFILESWDKRKQQRPA